MILSGRRVAKPWPHEFFLVLSELRQSNRIALRSGDIEMASGQTTFEREHRGPSLIERRMSSQPHRKHLTRGGVAIVCILLERIHFSFAVKAQATATCFCA